MKHEIIKNPMGLLQFSMDKGDKVTAESGSMVFSRGDIQTETKMRKGGFFNSLKAAAFGGESFFVNEFIANDDNCSLGLTGNVLGDIEVIPVNEEFIVQSGAYIASTSDLTLDTEWQGFKKDFFGSNLFMLKTMGSGDMFVNGYGGVFSTRLDGDESMILDNYQLVAMSSTA